MDVLSIQAGLKKPQPQGAQKCPVPSAEDLSSKGGKREQLKRKQKTRAVEGDGNTFMT